MRSLNRKHVLLARPALRDVLERARSGSVVMIVAPLGYGKTSLLKVWESVTHTRSTLFTLAARHDDPAILAAELAEALAGHLPEAVELAGRPFDGAWTDLLLRSMGGVPLLLMFDDAHLLTGRSLRILKRLVVETPPTLVLGIASRGVLNVGLARAQRERRLTQLGSADLILSRVDLDGLRRAGLRVRDIDEIYADTGGWPLAVRLEAEARLGVPGGAPPGAHGSAVDLVCEEVKASLPPDQLLFLADAAVLGSASVDLLDAARDASDTHTLVHHFAGHPFPLVHVDHDQVTVHPSCRGRLRRELRVREPGREAAVLQRAAASLRAQGRVARAFTLLQEVGDRPALARFAYEVGRDLAFSGRTGLVRTWIRTFSAAELSAFGELTVLCALLDGSDGSYMAMAEWLQAMDGRDLGPVVAAELGDTRPSEVFYELLGLQPAGPATQRVVAGQTWWTAIGRLTQGFTLLGRGDLVRAEGVLIAMAPHAQAVPVLNVIRLVCLAYLYAIRGELRWGRPLLEEARELWVALQEGGASTRPDGLDACLALYAALEPGQPGAGTKELSRAVEDLNRLKPVLPHRMVLVQAMLVEASLGLGRTRVAIDIVRDINASGPAMPGNEYLINRIRRLSVNLRDAKRWLPQGVDLSATELRVLSMLASSAPVPRIAANLDRSPATIRAHVRAIYKELGAHSRSEAVQRATELGLLTDEASDGGHGVAWE